MKIIKMKIIKNEPGIAKKSHISIKFPEEELRNIYIGTIKIKAINEIEL